MESTPDNLQNTPGKGHACICGKTDKRACDSSQIEIAQLLSLYNQIADVMHDHGCWCLAQKFKALAANWKEGADSTTNILENGAEHGNQLQCYLFPLTTALSTTAYYDYALNCVEVANKIDTTRELVYLQAFLYLALGETEQACKLYQHAARNWGKISPEELEQIRVLVHKHICEDDISEIYEELARNCS